MPKKYRSYHGQICEDPGGYTFDPHSSWEDDVLLQMRPWHDPALFYRYLNHLAEWREEGSEKYLRGDSGPRRIERGQVYMRLEDLGQAPGWNKYKVRRVLQLLARVGKITVEAQRGGVMITIVDYARYQDPAFYRATRAQRECNANRNAAKCLESSGDRPTSHGVDATRMQREPQRGSKRNPLPLPSPPFPSLPPGEEQESSRARGATPQAALARLGESCEPCSWWAIANAVRTGFWSGFSPRIRALQIAEAAGAGPPPGEIESEIRIALLQEAAELGIPVEMRWETGGEEARSAHDHEPIGDGNPAAPEVAPRAVPVPPDPDGSRSRAREKASHQGPAAEDGNAQVDSDLAPCGLVCSQPDPP